MLAVRIQFRHQAQVHGHARLARFRGIAGVEARHHRERIVPLGHGLGGHTQQHSVRVDEPDGLAALRKRHRLPLHHRDANLVRQHAHHARVLDPGNTLEFTPSLVQRDKKDVAADVFPKHGHQIGPAQLREAGSLNVAGASDTETRVAFNIMREHEAGRGQATQHQKRGSGKKHASHGAGRSPPGRFRLAEAVRGGAQHTVAVGIVELQRHTRSAAPRSPGADTPLQGHILPRAPAAQLNGWVVVPQQRSICGISLIGHAGAGS